MDLGELFLIYFFALLLGFNYKDRAGHLFFLFCFEGGKIFWFIIHTLPQLCNFAEKAMSENNQNLTNTAYTDWFLAACVPLFRPIDPSNQPSLFCNSNVQQDFIALMRKNKKRQLSALVFGTDRDTHTQTAMGEDALNCERTQERSLGKNHGLMDSRKAMCAVSVQLFLVCFSVFERRHVATGGC